MINRTKIAPIVMPIAYAGLFIVGVVGLLWVLVKFLLLKVINK